MSLEELRGRTIAYVDRESASGYLFVADLIAREVGSNALKDALFQGSHKAVIDAVQRKWVDAGATFVVRDAAGLVTRAGFLDLAADDQIPLRMLATTPAIPCDAIVHRPGLATGLVDRLARTLVDVDGDAEGLAVLQDVFGSSGMMRADLRIYDAVRAAMQRVKAA
jgi:ABC-type phosphate/phosphonate transport system substrate-binding protein